MTHIAGFIDYWTRGKVKPAHITTISLLGHIPTAWAIAYYRPVLGAVLLAGFSLLDALDGAMARVQGSTSLGGMYFDAVSDRVKEIIIYSALAVFVYKHIDITLVWQVVAVAGTSILVSYTKAKGEMAIAGHKKDAQRLNRLFSVGIAKYEVRVAFIVVGLLLGWIEFVLPILIALNSLTIATRFIVISRELFIIDQENIKKAHDKS